MLLFSTDSSMSYKYKKPSKKERLDAYREMLRARRIDEKSIVLYKQNKSFFQIGCAGHEAVQVAAAQCMDPKTDWAYPYYRDLAFNTAWGIPTKDFLLEIMSKKDAPGSGGRQMPSHWGNKDLHIVSQSSPTGTQFLQAVGAAVAIKRRGEKGVVYVSSGEGTTAQGEYHEALNWAAMKQLPIIFLIQNNEYAISVHISEQLAGESVLEISSGYRGLHVERINGLDYEASHFAFSNAVERARSGDGPSVIAARVVRLQSHSISDNQYKYRTPTDIAKDQELDPLILLAEKLIQDKVCKKEDLQKIQEEVIAEINEVSNWVSEQEDPDPETYKDHVYVDNYPQAEITEKEPPATEEKVFLVDAINKALREEMERNPEMVIYGEDVAGPKGGVFTVTQDLSKLFGKRVFNSPLAEASIIGTAIGLATLGFKPVVEIQFGDYIWTAMMQLRNELGMLHYRSNGMFSCPAVVRVAVGGYIRGSLYHSQNIESFFSHIPGILVVHPSNATDAKGLLKSAIRAKDPVLFLEHKGLYRQIYAKGHLGGEDDLIPIGKAKVVREGDAATIVTYGALVNKSLLAAEEMAKEGVQTEVIDLRTLQPLDTETILESVKKTGRLMVAHEDACFMGYGAEVVAQVAEFAFEHLDAPIIRVAGAFTPIAMAPNLEKMILPQNEDVLNGLRRLLGF